MANNRQLPPPPPPYRPGFPPMQPPKQMQYIGARYVPKFADPVDYNPLTAYEALTIVIYNRDSYTSRQPVPAGIDPSNSEYWVKTGDFNSQLNDLSNKIDGWDDEISAIEQTAKNAEEIAQKALDEVESTDISQLTERVDDLETGLASANTNISTNTASISSLNADLLDQGSKVKALETSQSEQDTKIDEMQTDISILQTATTSLSGQISIIKSAAESAQNSANAAAEEAIEAKTAAEAAKEAAEAISPDVEALKITVGDDSSGLVKDVSDLQHAIGDGSGTDSLSSRITALETSQNTQDTSIAANTTAITALQDTVGNETSGLVKDVADLKKTVGDTTGIDSLSERVETLETEIGADDKKGAVFPRLASVETSSTANASSITALSSKVDSLEEEIGGGTGGAGTLTARVEALETSDTSQNTKIEALETTQTSQGTKITTLETQIGTAQSDIDSVETDVADTKQLVGTRKSGDTLSAFEHIYAADTSLTSQASDITSLKETVGDASSGLVKDVTDNMGDISALQADVSEIQTQQAAQDIAISGATTAANNAKKAADNKAAFNSTPFETTVFYPDNSDASLLFGIGHSPTIGTDNVNEDQDGVTYVNKTIVVNNTITLDNCSFLSCYFTINDGFTLTLSNSSLHNCTITGANSQLHANSTVFYSCLCIVPTTFITKASASLSLFNHIVSNEQGNDSFNYGNYPDSLNVVRSYTDPVNVPTANYDIANYNPVFLNGGNYANIATTIGVNSSNTVTVTNVTTNALIYGMNITFNGPTTVNAAIYIGCDIWITNDVTFSGISRFIGCVFRSTNDSTASFNECDLFSCLVICKANLASDPYSLINSVFTTEITPPIGKGAYNFSNYPLGLNNLYAQIPINGGGTSASTADGAIWNLTLNSTYNSTPADSDIIPFGDVSLSKGSHLKVSDLKALISQSISIPYVRFVHSDDNNYSSGATLYFGTGNTTLFNPEMARRAELQFISSDSPMFQTFQNLTIIPLGNVNFNQCTFIDCDFSASSSRTLTFTNCSITNARFSNSINTIIETALYIMNSVIDNSIGASGSAISVYANNTVFPTSPSSSFVMASTNKNNYPTSWNS